jgi:hypothetical protein
MDLTKLSTNGLLKLHAATREAVEVDDNLPPDEFVYGVRVFPDWRPWADQIEAELDKRGVKYTKIVW